MLASAMQGLRLRLLVTIGLSIFGGMLGFAFLTVAAVSLPPPTFAGLAQVTAAAALLSVSAHGTQLVASAVSARSADLRNHAEVWGSWRTWSLVLGCGAGIIGALLLWAVTPSGANSGLLVIAVLFSGPPTFFAAIEFGRLIGTGRAVAWQGASLFAALVKVVGLLIVVNRGMHEGLVFQAIPASILLGGIAAYTLTLIKPSVSLSGRIPLGLFTAVTVFALLVWANMQMDVLLSARQLGYDDAGRYAILASLTKAFALFGSAIGALAIPRFVNAGGRRRDLFSVIVLSACVGAGGAVLLWGALPLLGHFGMLLPSSPQSMWQVISTLPWCLVAALTSLIATRRLGASPILVLVLVTLVTVIAMLHARDGSMLALVGLCSGLSIAALLLFLLMQGRANLPQFTHKRTTM